MTASWVRHLGDLVAEEGGAVRVGIVGADGSAPRGVGSAMTVGRTHFSGTIGGGALELEALREARRLLDEDRPQEPWFRRIREFPLGPALGQCCGGHVTLMFEVLGAAETAAMSNTGDHEGLVVRPLDAGAPWQIATHRKDDRAAWPLAVRACVREILSGAQRRQACLVDDWYIEPMTAPAQPLFLYGAGHVGRAVVKVFADLPFEMFWVDTDAARYPDAVPDDVHKLVAADPAEAARHAPAGAWHVVMTYSHALDLEICQAVLAGGTYGYVGVIASQTKRARFVKRLRETGLDEAVVGDLQAPIGLAGLEGKEPAMIAVSLAADFLLRLQQGSGRTTLPQTDMARGGS